MDKLSDESKKVIFESIRELKKVLNNAHREATKKSKSRGGAAVVCICGQGQTSPACSGLGFIKQALNYPECKEMAEYIGKCCL
jgi:hypothetical protein